MTADMIQSNDRILVTGAAGFIGYHLSRRLLDEGWQVVGVDNMNDYYDVGLKQARLDNLVGYAGFTFVRGDIADSDFVSNLFAVERPEFVVHLAAQAGVRHSIENPDAYVQSNIVGFFHILEACRHHPVKHLIYASSSSVYGGNTKFPFEESDPVDHPVSLYAATKKSNELMAHCYSHLYGMPATGLRFFTVYGPYGRPDMAYYSFADRYFKGEPITLYNSGDVQHDLRRDFTYISDVIEGIERLIERPPDLPDPHRVFNIGNNHPESLTSFVALLEDSLSNALGRHVVFKKRFEPMQPGDVHTTYASTEMLRDEVGFKPHTSLKEGLQAFADWYVDYHGLK